LNDSFVHEYLTPIPQSNKFTDQYAYKPTGSTTCALIDFTHRIHTLLETNRYVRCVLIDFSKAFDTVDHAIHIPKRFSQQVPPSVIKCILSFLSDRTHATRLDNKLSSYTSFNRSIVQRSGIVPTLFVIFASDLKPLDTLNYLIKYADDSSLLCPEHSNTSIETEMQHVMDWARLNKMQLNLLKTVELVFHRPNVNKDLLPAPIPDIKRVTSAKLLGVYFSSELRFTDHVSSVVSMCNQRLYLLTQLRRQGLSASARENVFLAIIVNRLMYALPVIYGSLSEKDKALINSIFLKAQRWKILVNNCPDLDTLADNAELRLFRQTQSNCHCLNHLYTPKLHIPGAMELRKRGHNFVLPTIKYDFNSRTFIARALFKFR